jgi:hypothetical protein
LTQQSGFRHALGVLVCLAGLTACEQPSQAYIAAADLTRHGFVRERAVAHSLNGRMVRVWGFVDHANLYGDPGTREILGEWWGGEPSDPATWRFNMKAHPDDKAGHSFAVHVRSDPGRHRLLSAIVADARAGRATRVYVTGTLRTFDAPTNAAMKQGIYLTVDASSGVVLGRRPHP